MSDEPHDPLAVLRVPPTAQQVIEHIYEELEHAISILNIGEHMIWTLPHNV